MEGGNGMKLKSYEINKTGFKGICKMPGIWALSLDLPALYPLVYFKKPKWMDEATFMKVIEAIRFDWPVDSEL
jgi:hypothetical protein